MARSMKILSVSVPEWLAEEMERMADEEGISESELVRLMLRAYRQERLEKELLRLQQGLAPKAKELGIESEGDVERLVLDNR